MTTIANTALAGAHLADLAFSIAERLTDPEPIITAAGPAAASLSRGLAGTALLHARLSTHHPRFEAAAGLHWAQAAQLSSSGPSRAGGIFNGRGALATSLILGAPYLPDPGQHRRSVVRGAKWLASRAAVIAAWQDGRRQRGEAGTPWHTYDVINGLAGIGAVLLAAARAGHADAEPGLAAARDSLTAMIRFPAGGRPGWWRPDPRHPAALADPHNRDAANTGLAHGIAGPLAFLALCQLAGHGGDAQSEAIGVAAQWLLSWQAADGGWPPQVTAEDLAGTAAAPSSRGRRDAWCYGTPGVGTALIAAGLALADQDLAEQGRRAIDAMSSRADTWDTEGPTVCHGSAGVALCAQTAGSTATAARATGELLAQCDPALGFYFRHSDHGVTSDDPGLLTGAAGIALTLAEQGGLAAPETAATWTAALLVPSAADLPVRQPEPGVAPR
jgi:lantibiotic biosynthesis protein